VKPVLYSTPRGSRTRKILDSLNLKLKTENLKLIEPVGYFDMIELLKGTKIVLTDSGGLQKEAFFFKKPCVTLRDETEWVELVEHGFNRLAGAVKERIIGSYRNIQKNQLDFNVNMYGNGMASRVIIERLMGSEFS
jgi:UDP-GlcNAc3NAcA epimerase